MRTRLVIAVVGSIFAFALAPLSAQPTPALIPPPIRPPPLRPRPASSSRPAAPVDHDQSP